jgi:hypothetical protein
MNKEQKYSVGETVNSIYCQQFVIASYDPEERFFPYTGNHGGRFTENELIPVPEDSDDFTEEDADRVRDEARASIAELEKKISRLKKLEWLFDTMYRGPKGSNG